MISRSWTESHRHGRGPAPNHPPAGAAGRGRRTDERSRPDGGRERGAARPHLRAQRGEPAHQREPRHRDRAERVVGSARALTGARYGAIATIDDAGVPQDFVTSGFTAEEHRKLVEWPDGPRLFEYFRDLPGPLRLADVPNYVRSLGFSSELLPSKTFQGTPMHHRGVHVGNFYLVEKEGGEAFTDGDEEVLVLFASQAATAIANARTYRAEQRAHAGLEALIETSPVGVTVFDAQTGDVISLNREARRIVEGLCLPGQSAEQLLETITCRRADGREIALARLLLARALSGAETVRAEEIAHSGADGRSVTTLINATPIHGPDGALASVVVTLQDLAPPRRAGRPRRAAQPRDCVRRWPGRASRFGDRVHVAEHR